MDTTAVYERAGALAVTQAPAGVSPYTLQQWVEGARVRCAPLVWRHPEEQAQDPGFSSELKLRTIQIEGSTEMMLLARDTPSRDYNGKDSAGTVLDLVTADWLAQWGDVIVEDYAPNKGESAEDFEARTRDALLWDSESAHASIASIPHSMDESVLLSFGSLGEPPDLPTIGAPLTGTLAFAVPNPPYLLETSTDGTDGEFDTQLLRAPAPGVVRFERYRHIVRDPASGRLTLRRPSDNGRLVIRATALEDVPGMADAFDDEAPLADSLRLVFEHVRGSAIPQLLAPQLADLVRRFQSLIGSVLFQTDAGGLAAGLRDTVGWIFRSWQALVEFDPGSATMPQSLRNTLAAQMPMAAHQQPDDDAITQVASAVAADQASWDALVAYLQETFVHLAIGDSWGSLDVGVNSYAGAEAGDAELELIELERVYKRWTPCFAGMPLGKAGLVWVLDDARADVWEDAPDGLGGFFADVPAAWRNTFSTFDVEALYQARIDGAGETIADHAAARAAGPISGTDMIQFGDDVLQASRLGWISVLRIVETEPPKHPYTAVDWLGEVMRGTVRRRYQEALFDFSDYAAAQHPLAQVVHWDDFVLGRALRDRFDDLLNHEPVPGVPLQIQSRDWWATATHLDASNKWPSPFSLGTRVTPRPSDPYRAAGTASSGRDRAVTRGRRVLRLDRSGAVGHILWDTLGGWDDFDLMRVLRVANMVRYGRTLTGPIHPALVLAVAEVEGYRTMLGQNRNRRARFDSLFTSAFKASLPASVRGGSKTAGWLDSVARELWGSWTFGGDMMHHPRTPAPKPSFKRSTHREDAAAHFEWLLNRLMRVDWHGQPGEAPPATPVDPAFSLLDPTWFAPGDFARWVEARLSARWITFSGQPGVRYHRLTRRLEYAGLAMQSAMFQWVHHQLSEEAGYLNGEVYSRVEEMVDAALAPPVPGADALADERRSYIAYWATVYLAFNASVSFFNHWVNESNDDKNAGERVSEFLLYRLDNSAVSPAALGTTSLQKRFGTLGATAMFALSLDAYLRVDYGLDPQVPAATDVDLSDPATRPDWGAAP